MGQAESHPSHHQLGKRGDTFVLISNEPKDCFRFDPAESYLVSYGIDYQTHPKFKKRTLGPSTIADAREVIVSLVNTGAIPRRNAVLYEASKQPDDCTAGGMKRGFQAQARKVGANGLFVFHFSGHGIRVRNDQWGLAPVDFDYTTSTYLTANVLNDWLHEIGCKAKHILFTLDCCYAGGIGNELTRSGEFDLVSGLYVLSSCTANETSLVIGPLGHSIFAYFLCRAITMTVQPGRLPLQEIFTECHTTSIAMSSLIVSYNAEHGLKWGTMEPELKFLDLRTVALEYMGEGVDQTDATIARFQYALKLYDYRKPIAPLDDKTIAWLETVADEALRTLERKGTMVDRRVLLTVVCSMIYSVASIELACNSAKLHNPNHFITSFVHAMAALDMIHHGVELSQEEFLVVWEFYYEVVKLNLGKEEALTKLYCKALSNNRRARQESSSVPPSTGIDYTDSGQDDLLSSVEDSVEVDIPTVGRWIPILPEERSH